MSATYNPSLATPTDRMRLALGDTNTDAPLRPDDTYAAMLAHHGGDERKAKIELADGLVTQYAQMPSRLELAGDGGAAEWKDRLGAWSSLAKRLRDEIERDARAAAARAASGFRVLRPTRDGCVRGEYYGGGRQPW